MNPNDPSRPPGGPPSGSPPGQTEPADWGKPPTGWGKAPTPAEQPGWGAPPQQGPAPAGWGHGGPPPAWNPPGAGGQVHWGGGAEGPMAPGPGIPPGWSGQHAGQGWGGQPPMAAQANEGSGLRTAALILSILGLIAFLAGLFPCFGILNWLGVPFNLVTLIIGVIGLSQPGENKEVFIAATIIGAVGILGGGARCVLGGFLL
ncbi:MAG: hypothetical protein KC731_39650 [Myxococcales bacterium]|nr:hypothetical protein [Myxococcales bacterium]